MVLRNPKFQIPRRGHRVFRTRRTRRPGSRLLSLPRLRGRRIEAEGEAAAIFVKLEAEAKGNYEILAKKGEGLERIVQAYGGADAAFKMLMLEHMDTLAETSAQAISNIKFDKVIVWENGGNRNGKGSTADFLNNLAHSLPPMMQVMKDVGGVEFPEYLAKIVTEEKPSGNSDGDGTKAEPAKTE